MSELVTLEPPATPDEVERREASPGRRWVDIAVPTALVAGTAATRLPYLSTPRAFVFDEIYYAPDAASILRNGVEQGGVVHPPGGKWLIAGGIKVFGFTSFGWRFAALVAGCLIVLLTYVTARQLVRGHVIPALAAGAVALDGVSFTTGRVGMLDVFLALFTMLAVTFTVFALRHPENQRRVNWCRCGRGSVVGTRPHGEVERRLPAARGVARIPLGQCEATEGAPASARRTQRRFSCSPRCPPLSMQLRTCLGS